MGQVKEEGLGDKGEGGSVGEEGRNRRNEGVVQSNKCDITARTERKNTNIFQNVNASTSEAGY
jgi:hypothetical protein